MASDRRRAATPFSFHPPGRLREFLREVRLPDGGYLTLAAVDEARRERQLGRLDAGAREQLTGWVIRTLEAHLGPTAGARIRLRRWGPGGTALGSVSFEVRRKQAEAQQPTANSSQELLGLREEVAALRRELAAVRDRVSALEDYNEELTTRLAEWAPVIDAADAALQRIATIDL